MDLENMGSAIAAALTFILAAIAGLVGFGRLQQRVNGQDHELELIDTRLTSFDKKMDAHTKTSAEQWAQVQRSLGRIEGAINASKTENKDAG